MFELTISLGSILTMASFLVGGLVFALSIKGDTRVHEARFDSMSEQQREIREELKKLSEVLIKLAVQDGRIKAAEDRIAAQGLRLDETSGRLNAYIDANIFSRMKAFEGLAGGRDFRGEG